jgi:hypothetical protein
MFDLYNDIHLLMQQDHTFSHCYGPNTRERTQVESATNKPGKGPASNISDQRPQRRTIKRPNQVNS